MNSSGIDIETSLRRFTVDETTEESQWRETRPGGEYWLTIINVEEWADPDKVKEALAALREFNKKVKEIAG